MSVSITSNHNRNIGGRQTGDLSHNRRTFFSKNVDRRLTKNNIVFKNITIEEVYLDAFEDAIDAHNKKQKRKNRIKYNGKSYFEYLFKAKPAEKRAQMILTSNARGGNAISSFNEDIFQVSDCYEYGHFMRDSNGNLIDKNGNPIRWNQKDKKFYDINGNEVKNSKNLIPNPKAEVVKEILSVFYLGGRFKIIQDQNGVPSLKRLEEYETDENEIVIPSFEERNPNFKVIVAIMHNDEWHGTPHIHIDYVPVGEGYKRGPEKQIGFERALFNMGFEDKRTAYAEWREKERVILKQICNYFGLETKAKEEEKSRGETYSPKVYKEAVRKGKTEAQEIVENATQEANLLIEEAQKIKELAETEAKLLIENAKQEALEIKEQAEAEAQEIKNNAVAEAKAIIEHAKELESNAVRFNNEAFKKAHGTVEDAQVKADKIINEARDEAKNIKKDAQTENEELKTENRNLKEESNKLAEEDKARSAELKEKIEVCLELASVLPKKKPIKLGKKILVSEDDYNNALRIGAAASRLNENYIVSSNCLRLLQEELAAAEEKEREADEKLANEDRHIKDEAEAMKEADTNAAKEEYESRTKKFKKNHNAMVDYINDTTGRSVGEVLAEHFRTKNAKNRSFDVQNINAPQNAAQSEKSRFGDEYCL
ncbi:MAG: hypothetical protein NC085_12070 [Muribaculaceae bacterium]|nr:hypothetical protein [Muribaculaceae bacterium]